MVLLSRLKLRSKLALLLVMATLAVLGSIAVGASSLRGRMLEDRIEKIRTVVEMTWSLADALEGQVRAGKLTREQALDQFRSHVHALRFDDGKGYVVAQGEDDIIIAFGPDPKRDGTQALAKDSNGRSNSEQMREVLRSVDRGVITYFYPKPGETVPKQKVAFVARFPPWKAMLLTGVWVDDLDTDYRDSLWRLAAAGGGILLAMLLLAWLVNRDIAGSLDGLRTTMHRLSHGELQVEVPGTGRRDEVGAMARSILVFQKGMREADTLAKERAEAEARLDEEKRASLVRMAEAIESETRAAMDQIGGRASALASTAESMSASASRTGTSAQSATAASSHALTTVQTVASAAEELAASIKEISGQVNLSTVVVGRAVEAGAETRKTIEALNEQVAKIGAVADMIGEIAGKTNLLALNATIEAARAGDAGKGFAVVASEVKALANQTARSTQEIARHLGEVRTATSASVAAVARIEETITEVNTIAGSIAAAVEEQGAATSEIARNVAETAAAAEEMTGRTGEVSNEAKETLQRAAEVMTTTSALGEAVSDLKQSVIRVVRTSAAEVDRRAAMRHQTHASCTVSVGGQSHTAQLRDLSEGGAHIVDGPALTAGARGTLTISGVGFPLPFTVRSSEGKSCRVAFNLDAAMAASFRGVPERIEGRRAA